MNHFKVVIIGGGLAGLHAACQLEKAGVAYALLEAKPRLGGRILSKQGSAKGAHAMDLGPTWFWPHQPRIQAVLKEWNIPCFEQYTQGDTIYQMQRGEKPQRVSDVGTMLSYRVCGGMHHLIQAMAAEKQQLLLAHPVVNLDKNETGWRITAQHMGETKSFNADFLILAAPPRVLLQHLPLKKWLSASLYRQLLATPTWMAAQAKFVATYATAFWRDAGLSGDAFSRVGPMGEVHDTSADMDDGYALFGFLGIPAQSRARFSAEELKQACLNQLADLFGKSALQPEASYLKDWALDSWVATDRDVMEQPVHPDMNLALHAEELAELNLGFAATEVARDEAGYLEGALLAAEAAVSEYLTR